MKGLSFFISVCSGQDGFIPGSFIGVNTAPQLSSSFDAAATGPDPLVVQDDDVLNQLGSPNHVPSFIDHNDGTKKNVREHPLRAIAGAHSQIRHANQSPQMRMSLSNTEAFVSEYFDELASNPFGIRTEASEEMAIERAFNMTQMRSQGVGDCGGRLSSLDGSCNNRFRRGSVLDSYSRMAPSNYCNGRDKTRCFRNGSPLPNPRRLSLLMQTRTVPKITFSPDRTRLMADFGQFLTHDIIQTPDMAGSGRDPCNCKEKAECDNILLHGKDPVIKFECFFIVKSVGRLARTGPKGVVTKEQVNQLTSFIDLTNVYGFDKEHLTALRTHEDGSTDHKLFLPDNGPDRGTRLPTVRDPSLSNNVNIVSNFRTEAFLNEKALPSPVAGDTRCAENVMLTSFHTAFARLHNVLAEGLEKHMPTENMDHVFMEARQVNIAIMNHLVFNEFLPAVLGEDLIQRFALLNLQPGMGQTAGKLNSNQRSSAFDEKEFEEEFDPELMFDGGARKEQFGSHFRPSSKEPSIRNEFGAALFRWGHAMQPNLLQSRNKFFEPTENRLLRENWFDPQMLARQSPARMLRGGMMVPGVEVGPKWIDDTVHFFFKPIGAKSGIDLMAVNIARGRDHGINSFTEVRKACMRRFRGLYQNARMKPGWGNIVRAYGGKQDEVDLYIGMMMEEPVPGSKLGPTTVCSVVDQFVALKEGDKHYYEGADMFSPEQLAEVKKMTLASVFCKTMTDEDFDATSEWPMVKLGATFKGRENKRLACSEFADFDFSKWADKKPVPTSQPSVVSLSHATPAPDKFDVEPVKKLTLADLRAIGSESRCGPTMFDKMRLDLNSMSVKCESPTKSNTFCKFVCLSDQQMFLPGSIHNVQCRGGNVRKPSLPRGMPHFAKCVPVPTRANPNPKTTLRFCGNIRGADKIQFDIAGGVRPNCGGMACFPTCDDPTQEPSHYMIRCHRTRRRTFHVPAKAMVTCVDKPRTMLGNCGDLADAENPKLVNQINQETVKIECYSDFCRLKCRSSLMGFRPGPIDWNTRLIFCNQGMISPTRRIDADCAPGLKTASDFASESTFAAPEAKPDGEAGKCDQSIYTQFNVDMSHVNVKCSSKKCNVMCKDGDVPDFVWPDGNKVKKNTYICKKGANWVPRFGSITCPNQV